MAAPKMTTEFTEKTLTLRGKPYVIRELSIGEYDDVVRKATDTKKDGLGEDIEVVDNARLLRLMVLKSLQSPKVSLDQFSELPARIVFALNNAVNAMHRAEDLEVADAPEDEGEAKGNAD